MPIHSVCGFQSGFRMHDLVALCLSLFIEAAWLTCLPQCFVVLLLLSMLHVCALPPESSIGLKVVDGESHVATGNWGTSL